MTRAKTKLPAKGYLLLVEWDGQTPPSTWYNRLHDYGLWVRGNKDKSPLARRETKLGVVSQEGAIIVESHSFAQLLATIATNLGAKLVLIGSIQSEEHHMSKEDEQVYQRITAQKKKTGPKRKTEKGSYVITCLEEARTHEVKLEEPPHTCPKCGGLRISWRRGTKVGVNILGSYSVTWLESRFFWGTFEIPEFNEKEEPGHLDVPDGVADPIGTQAAYALVKVFNSRDIAFRAMDIAYCLSVIDEKKKVRIDRRVGALREYYAGGGTKQYSLSIPSQVDLVDVAGVDRKYVKYL